MSSDGLVLPRTGRVITDCESKVRHFCLHDAYPKYDVVGREYAGSPNTLHPDLLTAMNRAMMARSSRKGWAPLLGVELPELAAIPVEADLVEAGAGEYAALRELLRAYYARVSDQKGLTDMAGSKMLFLKRPRLAAISDSYVREALGVDEPRYAEHPWKAPWCAERALRVSDAAREVGLANHDLLSTVQQATAEFALSMCRIIDILVWAEMAIAQGHQGMVAAAKEKGWAIVGR